MSSIIIALSMGVASVVFDVVQTWIITGNLRLAMSRHLRMKDVFSVVRMVVAVIWAYFHLPSFLVFMAISIIPITIFIFKARRLHKEAYARISRIEMNGHK